MLSGGAFTKRARPRRSNSPSLLPGLDYAQYCSLGGESGELPWGGLQPNAAYFSRTWDSAFVVGRTPWSARDAPVPLPGRRIKSFHNSTGRLGGPAADEGVRPTNYAGVRLWKVSGIGLKPAADR